jgi:hypothetical protein
MEYRKEWKDLVWRIVCTFYELYYHILCARQSIRNGKKAFWPVSPQIVLAIRHLR